ncbi:MAG: cysteine desulfurase family protein [Clostridia bacterium]|nr:cysteine desulfurase family protein [Clostridia bacterium]
MTRCLNEGYFNPSSVYKPAVEAFRFLREARENLLDAVHGEGCEATFTSGGTEANNLAVLGAVGRMRGRQVVAVSAVEHPSVRAAFDALKEQGHDVRVIGVTGSGELRWDELEAALDDGASLVSCMQVNNETGALLDAERLHRLVDGRALIHVDGVQGFLRVPFDMKWADMYTLSGHKIHGPKGIGALVVKKGVRLKPQHIGGGQESGLRSGTENTPGIAGLNAAVLEMRAMGPDMPAALMAKKLRLVEAVKRAVPEALINGPEPEKAAPHIVNIGFPDVRGEVMLHALEGEGIYVSTGSACSSKKLKVSSVLVSMGIKPSVAEWAVRFSLSPHTTEEEIDYAAGKIGTLYDQLRRFKRR